MRPYGFQRLEKLAFCALPAASVPADMAPPTGLVIGISAFAVAVLVFLVLGIVAVSILVIRSIKRSLAGKNTPDKPD